ncbi:hypothetical protein [Streptomyces sp. NPDC001020]
MASIRTARVLAAAAALPLAATLFTGVASADNGSFANDGSNAAAASMGGGVGHDNNGNSSTTQQQAVGFGASNRSNTAQVKDSAFTTVNQGNGNVVINFGKLW